MRIDLREVILKYPFYEIPSLIYKKPWNKTSAKRNTFIIKTLVLPFYIPVVKLIKKEKQSIKIS